VDINNVYVNATNQGVDPRDFIEHVPQALIREIHLGGFDVAPWGVIDTHGDAIAEPVWALLAEALHLWGKQPIVIERDNRLPEFEVLVKEVERAEGLLNAL
jgi:uncharacterized protein (UPF0276 family)